ncbi:hypothetical protein SOM61_02485 [Massilia sp. CFBP9012]|uniref:hypothetical protein n=1 Tax=Massilia sp. CFBP9012 TaxID=3096531 RepID=UPI002A69D6C6|nr:hypothetical protein [Massilia sp. CFBP9012]MDY0973816.1 hypothetical protein [Massilia sp. CFBP9012]
MTSRFVSFTWLRALLVVLCLAAALPARAQCTATGACITAGPRLASIDTNKSALLGPLLGGLLGTGVSLNALDWNALAGGNLNLLNFLKVLQTQLNLSSPSQVLGANVTLAQIANALSVEAQAEAKPQLAAALSGLASQLNGAGATVRLGDLLKITADTGSLGTTTVNALDMFTGLIQLYNRRNVLTTPVPVGISGGVLGAAGIVNSLQLYAQVIEPPSYVCGPTGSTFYSAAVRIKLKLDLISLAPLTDTLVGLGLLQSASIAIGKLDVYADVARGQGSLAAVNAATKAVTLQVAPGVADLYIGKIDDGVFFNRTRTIQDSDVDYGNIGNLQATLALGLASVNIPLDVKSIVRAQAPFSTSVTMSGSFPQTRTVSSSTMFVTNAANSLVSNLKFRDMPSLGLLQGVVQPLVVTLVTKVVSPLLAPILSGVADPLLKLLGIGLGEMVVTVEGICQTCDDFKLTKAADKSAALPGATIVYTITFENTGTTTLNNLKVSDPTPAYTTYVDSNCGSMPAGLSCIVASKPEVGATGKVEWGVSGTLAPGATGSVTISVKVQ